jgi:predicted ATPase
MSTSSSQNVLLNVYKSQVDKGKIKYDNIQVRTLSHLDELFDKVVKYGGPNSKQLEHQSAPIKSTSWWQSWIQSSSKSHKTEPSNMIEPPKGLYIHGGVGCGKVCLQVEKSYRFKKALSLLLCFTLLDFCDGYVFRACTSRKEITGSFSQIYA